MRITRSIITMIVIVGAMFAQAGDSAPFMLDTREERAVESSIVLPYDAAWIGGNSGATVVIDDNGVEIARKTDAGEFEYQLTGPCKHTLTYKTLINDVVQEETYTAMVFKGWVYEVDDNGDSFLADTAYKSGDVVIPHEIDGHKVIGIGERAFEGCEALTSVTIPDSVWNIGEGAFAGCSSLRRVEAAIGLKRLLDSDGMFADCPQDLEVVYHQTAEIRNVVARQRNPWNGKVDITFEVEGNVAAGFSPNALPVIRVSAEDRVAGTNYVAVADALIGDVGTEAGTHHVIWDLDVQGLEFESDAVVFTVTYGAPVNKYCVIDLSAGADAASYPVSYIADEPTGGWTDEYKTTKLVLRLVEPGSFKMSGQYNMTLTKPYYMGVFEVTQKQYELVMGSNPSRYIGDTRPVERVSYDMIRGSSAGSQWPASSAVDESSFIGKIRDKTELYELDLPTEAQWEYACRAGTNSAYNNGGDAEDDLKILDRYDNNQLDGSGGYSLQHTAVGSYMSNAWGIYNMHGNVMEWCLDWYGDINSGSVDPVGPLSGGSRVMRGGCWCAPADNCTSSHRGRQVVWHGSDSYGDFGFRMARTMSDAEGMAASGVEVEDVLCSAESTAVSIDSLIEPVAESSILVAWDAAWIGGDENATVVIEDNGVVVTNVTGAGEFEYALEGACRHNLTYTTLIDNVEQEEIYSATVFKGWKYEIVDGNATLTGTAQKSGEIVVPSEIDGCPVVDIGDVAFEGCDGLESITMSVRFRPQFGDAINGCAITYIATIGFVLEGGEMTNLVMLAPTGDFAVPPEIDGVAVVGIGDGAFEGCVGLAGVTIPASVTSIGSGVFSGCSALTDLVFEGDAPDVAEGAFSGLSDEVTAHIHIGAKGFDSQRGKWNGLALAYIEGLPYISFGDTYRYDNTDWEDGGYIERTLHKSNYMQIFADGEDSHTHIALLEVLGASSKDEIKPEVENLGFKGTFTTSVWTDEELQAAVLPPPSTMGEWWSGWCSVDTREPNDISGPCSISQYRLYEYESDNGEFAWPYDLWPDNKAVAGRFWVAVECKASEVNRWGGIDGGFRVWQSDIGMKSEPMYVTYETEGSWPCITNLPTLFRGLSLTNSDRYGFDMSFWDVYHSAYGITLASFWLDSMPERPGAPLQITLPEAGILYLTSYYGNLTEIDVENADSVELKFVSRNQDDAMGRERHFYEYCADFNYRGVLAVQVDSARTIQLAQEDEFDDYDINRFQFFPNGSKAVAVEAAFVSIFNRNRYPRSGHENTGAYLQGYVTGTGVYKVGEEIALTAVAAPGEVFDHWELKYGNFPEGIDTTKETLNFIVTEDCAGTAEERKQMVVSAVWKSKKQITATTGDIIEGFATGSGLYLEGTEVALTAVPNKGYEFTAWSDGVTTASRTVTVSGDAEYVAEFEVSRVLPIEDVLDGPWVTGTNGVSSVEGRFDDVADICRYMKFMAADEACSWVETVVTNACRVSFDWKSSCEEIFKGKPYDYLSFVVDGEPQDFICGETDWTNMAFHIIGEGEHILRWTFQRDEDGSYGQDSAWLANVQICPLMELVFVGVDGVTGTLPSCMTLYQDEFAVLPGQESFALAKHSFAGWSDGVSVFPAGYEYPGDSEVMTLVTAWTRKEVGSPIIIAPSDYEADSLTVAIAAASEEDCVYYTTDGSDPCVSLTRTLYTGAFEIAGSVMVRAVATRDDWFDSDVVESSITRLPWTYGEYLGIPGNEFEMGGDSGWTRDKELAGTDGYALKSGAIADSQRSVISTTFDGAGTLAFRCKVSSEFSKKTAWDGLAVYIDAPQKTEEARLVWIGGEIDWTNVVIAVDGPGHHVIEWSYEKDDGGSFGEDCAWLDEVVWTPTTVAPVVTINEDKMEVPVETEAGVKTIEAKENQTLSQADADEIAITIVMESESEPVDTTEGYNKTYDPTSNTIVITLKEPEVGASATTAEETKVEGDATGMLADVNDENVELATEEPTLTEEEVASGTTEVGALPVKAVKGLWYQASWGSDLSNMRQGEKVQATGDTLYLGVIKQQATQGFYKVTVSEQ